MTAPDGDPMPVFTIKAKDRLAVSAVHAYQKLCMAYGIREQAAEVGKALAEILDWRRRHPQLIKLPDHVHVLAVAELPPDASMVRTLYPDLTPVGRRRCPSCEHWLETFHQPEGCWFSVTNATTGANTVCPCSVSYSRPEGDAP